MTVRRSSSGMKLFLDSKARRFIKSAASNVALQTLVLKRRDQVPIEVVFVENGVAVDPILGTQTTVALKSSFSDANFLALAAPGQTILDLNTVPVEAAFSSDPASISAYLEIRWSAPSQALRTATLQVEVQNSVILGDEQTPAALPDGKATQAEAEAGTDNAKWMTPLRTAQAIAELAPPPTWDSVLNKPATFPPSTHTHTASQITDFASAVVAVSPPVDWSSLTGKPSTFAPSAHTHPISEINGLGDALDAANDRIDDLLANLDPAALDSISEAVEVINTERTERIAADAALQTQIDGKATAVHTHLAADITDLASAVETLAPTPTTPANSGLAISGNSLATAYNSSIADGVVSVAVGGAPAAPASAWKAKNIVQVLDDILFPTILASVGSAKSITLGVSGASGVLEIGSSIARTLTATFGRGTILNGTGSTNSNPLVGDATGYTFTGTGISSTAQPGNALAFTTAVVSGSNNWAVTAAHAAGTGDYFDNKGVSGTNLAASRASGTATDTTSAPTITGVHPFYHLKSSSPISAAAMVTAIQNGTATKIIADSTGTLTIPYAPSAQYLAIAYPSTSTTKTRYFVTALDNGAITVVFAPVATLSVTTALWTQSYKIHTSSGALTNSAANIELRNS